MAFQDFVNQQQGKKKPEQKTAGQQSGGFEQYVRQKEGLPEPSAMANAANINNATNSDRLLAAMRMSQQANAARDARRLAAQRQAQQAAAEKTRLEQIAAENAARQIARDDARAALRFGGQRQLDAAAAMRAKALSQGSWSDMEQERQNTWDVHPGMLSERARGYVDPTREAREAELLNERLNAGIRKNYSIRLNEIADSMANARAKETAGARTGDEYSRQIEGQLESLKRTQGPLPGGQAEHDAKESELTREYYNSIPDRIDFAQRSGNEAGRARQSDRGNFTDEEIKKYQKFMSDHTPYVLRALNNYPAFERDMESYVKKYGFMPGRGEAEPISVQMHELMTDKEYQTAMYLYNTKGMDAYLDYLEYMQDTLNERRRNRNIETAQMMSEVPVAGSAMSLLFNVMNEMGGAYYQGRQLGGAAIRTARDVLSGDMSRMDIPGTFASNYHNDPGSAAYDAGVMRDVMRQADAERLRNWAENTAGLGSFGGAAANFVYNGVMSSLDSLVNSAFGGAGSAMMGIGAMNDTVRQTIQRGGSEEQALLMGLISGGLEMWTESERFADISRGFKRFKGGNADEAAESIAKVILKSMGEEANEEMASEMGNILADIFIMGDESEWVQKVKELESQGMDSSLAAIYAMGDMALQIAEAGAGGAFGGLLGQGRAGMQAMAYRVANYVAKNDVVKLSKQYDAETAKLFIDGYNPDAMTPAQYKGAFDALYQAGEAGMTDEQVYSKAGDLIDVMGEDAADRIIHRGAESGIRNETAEDATAGLTNTQKQMAEAKARAAARENDMAQEGVTEAEIGEDTQRAARAEDIIEEAGLTESVREAEAGREIADMPEASQDQGESYTRDVQAGVVRAYGDRKLTRQQENQLRALDALGKRYGVEFEIKDTLRGGTANGIYVRGQRRIQVALDATAEAYVQAGAHELVHYLRNGDSEGYNIFEAFVLDTLSRSGSFDLDAAVRERISSYAAQGVTIDEALAREEIVAEAVPQVFATESVIKEFVAGNRTLAQKVADWLREFVAAVRESISRYADIEGRSEIKALEGNVEALEEIASAFDAALGRAQEKRGSERAGMRIISREDVAAASESEEAQNRTQEEKRETTQPAAQAAPLSEAPSEARTETETAAATETQEEEQRETARAAYDPDDDVEGPGMVAGRRNRRENRTGGVDRSHVSEKFSREERMALRALDEVCKRYGVTVRLDEEMDADALYVGNGRIYLSVGAVKEGYTHIAMREMARMLRAENPEGWKTYREAVLQEAENLSSKYDADIRDSEIKRRVQMAKELGHEITEEMALDDMAAEASEMVLTDEFAIRRILNVDGGFLAKARDFLQEFIGRIRNAAVWRSSEHGNAMNVALDGETESLMNIADALDRALGTDDGYTTSERITIQELDIPEADKQTLLDNGVKVSKQGEIYWNPQTAFNLKSTKESDFAKDNEKLEAQAQAQEGQRFSLKGGVEQRKLKKRWERAYDLGVEMASRYDSEEQAFRAMDADTLEDMQDFENEAFFTAGFNGFEPEWVEAVRWGDIPEGGRSINHAENRWENGVSAIKIIRDESDWDARSIYDVTLGGQGFKKRRIAGWWLGQSGSDGEPLLIGAEYANNVGKKFSLKGTSDEETDVDATLRKGGVEFDFEDFAADEEERAKAKKPDRTAYGQLVRARETADKTARRYLKEYYSKYDQKLLEENLVRLTEEIALNGATKDTLQAATDLARAIIEKGEMEDPYYTEINADAIRSIKGTRIKLSPEQIAYIRRMYGTVRAFKKVVGNVFTLSTENGVAVDKAWMEFAETAAGLADQELINPMDMIDAMPYIAESLKPRAVGLEQLGMDVDAAAVELGLRIQSDALARVSMSQRVRTENEALRQRNAQLGRENRKLEKKADKADALTQENADLQAENENLTKQAAYTAEQAQRASESFRKLADQLKAHYQEQMRREKQRIIDRRRQAFDDVAAQLKAADETGDAQAKADAMRRYRQVMRMVGAEQAEAAARVAARHQAEDDRARSLAYGRIRKRAQDLKNTLAKPDRKKHIPFEMQAPVLRVLESMDFRSGGRETVSSKQWRDDLKAIADFLARQLQAQQSGTGKNSDNNLWMSLCEETIDRFNTAVDTLTKAGQSSALTEMTAAELTAYSNALAILNHAINTVNETWTNARYATMDELGRATVDEMRKLRDKKIGEKSPLAAIDNLLNVDNLDAGAFMERLGGKDGAAYTVYEELRRGQDKAYERIRQASEATPEMLGTNVKGSALARRVKEIRGWSEEKHTFKIPGIYDGKPGMRDVTLTGTQLMEMYALSKREQARKHLLTGGFMVKDAKGNIGNRTVKIDEDMLNAMISELTDDQKRTIDRLQSYLSTVVSEWGNEVTEDMFLFRMFGEENYWPLTTESGYRRTKAKDGDMLFNAVINMGFTKKVQDMVSNPIVIGDALTTYAGHVSQMATYSGMARPMDDFLRWYNYAVRDENGRVAYEGSVKKEIERVIGRRGVTYIEKLMNDLNGMGDRAMVSGWAPKLLSNYKRAAVAAKLRVAIQQPTAILRASAVMNPKYLIGINMGIGPATREEMQEHSPLAWWKGNGNYEIGTGQSMKSIITGMNDTVGETAMEKAGALAGKMDDIGWGAIWQAVKRETAAEHKELAVGSDEYWDHVRDRFEEVCMQTQVVDTVLTRSAAMRSKDSLMTMATAFMSEPTKNYNLIRSAIGEYSRALQTGEAGAKGKAIKRMALGLLGIGLSQALNAVMTGLFDAFKYYDPEDEDEEGNPVSRMDLFIGNWQEDMIDGINPLSNIPFVKDVWDIVKGGDVERTDMSAVTKLVSAVQRLQKYAGGNANGYTTWSAIKPTITAMGDLLGLPVSGLVADIELAFNILNPGATRTYEPDRVKNAAVETLYEAIATGDTAKAEEMFLSLKSGKYGRAPMSEKDIQTELSKMLTMNDPRIAEAWEMKQDPEGGDWIKIWREIKAEGFDADVVSKAINDYPTLMKADLKKAMLKAQADGEDELVQQIRGELENWGVEPEKLDKWLNGEDLEEDLTVKATYFELYQMIRAGEGEEEERMRQNLMENGDSNKDISKGLADQLALHDERIEEMYWLREDGQASRVAAMKRQVMADGFTDEEVTQAINRFKSLKTAELKEQYLDTVIGGEKASDMPEWVGNVHMTNRPVIDAKELVKAGWDDAGEGIATIYTSTYGAGDRSKDEDYNFDYNQNVVINVTPITANGKVLGPEQLDDYLAGLIEKSIKSGQSLMDLDKTQNGGKGLLLSVDNVTGSLNAAYDKAGRDMEKLHLQQEAYYEPSEGDQGIKDRLQKLGVKDETIAGWTAGKDMEEELEDVKEYTSAHLYGAIRSGETTKADILDIRDYLISKSEAEDPEASVISDIKSAFKKEYIEAFYNKPREAERLKKQLMLAGVKEDDIDGWIYSQKGLAELISSGGSESEIAEYAKHCVDLSDAKDPEASVASGVKSALKDEYLALIDKGDTSGAQTLKQRMMAAGVSEDAIDKLVTTQQKASGKESISDYIDRGDSVRAAEEVRRVIDEGVMTKSSVVSWLNSIYKEKYCLLMDANKEREAEKLIETLMDLGLKKSNGNNYYSPAWFRELYVKWRDGEKD